MCAIRANHKPKFQGEHSPFDILKKKMQGGKHYDSNSLRECRLADNSLQGSHSQLFVIGHRTVIVASVSLFCITT
jgi:hypothetical protein